MQRYQIGVLSPRAQHHVGVGSKHDIVLVTHRVLQEKIALPSAGWLNSNHAMFTIATVSQCLLYFEIVHNAMHGCDRHPFRKFPGFSLIKMTWKFSTQRYAICGVSWRLSSSTHSSRVINFNKVFSSFGKNIVEITVTPNVSFNLPSMILNHPWLWKQVSLTTSWPVATLLLGPMEKITNKQDCSEVVG